VWVTGTHRAGDPLPHTTVLGRGLQRNWLLATGGELQPGAFTSGGLELLAPQEATPSDSEAQSNRGHGRAVLDRHYYRILFCEALKMGLGGGRVPGPPRLIGAGPPAVQPPRLID